MLSFYSRCSQRKKQIIALVLESEAGRTAHQANYFLSRSYVYESKSIYESGGPVRVWRVQDGCIHLTVRRSRASRCAAK